MKIKPTFEQNEKDFLDEFSETCSDFCDNFDCCSISCDDCPLNDISERIQNISDKIRCILHDC